MGVWTSGQEALGKGTGNWVSIYIVYSSVGWVRTGDSNSNNLKRNLPSNLEPF
jgi:hypothetical protein